MTDRAAVLKSVSVLMALMVVQHGHGAVVMVRTELGLKTTGIALALLP